MEVRNLMRTLFVLMIVHLLLACSRDVTQSGAFPALSPKTFNHLMVTTSNYRDNLGELVSVSLTETSAKSQIRKGSLPLTSDSWFRIFSGNPNVFVLNRFSSNIQIFRKDTLAKVSEQRSLSAEAEFQLPPNPQDVVIDALGFVLVSGLNLSKLIRLTPEVDSVVQRWDLSRYADPIDKLPECAHMDWVNGKLWIAMQRLNRGVDRKSLNWLPTDHSSVVVFDPADGSQTEIKLAGINPVSPFRLVGNYVYFADRGGNAENTGGGIERIDSRTLIPTMVMSEAELKGKPADLVVSGDTAWVILEKKDFGTKLVQIDLVTKTIGDPIMDTDSTSFIKGLAYDSERKFLFFGDRFISDPGIRVWNTVSETFEFKDPIRVGFPPEAFELME